MRMKKLILAVLTVGLVVGGMHGLALAGKNNPNLAATGHPGYAPDYYYPMTSGHWSVAQNIRRDTPHSPYWNAEGATGSAGKPQSTASRTPDMIPFSS